MRATLTSLVLLAVGSIPAGSQVTATIRREPMTLQIRAALLNPASPASGRRGQQNLTVQLTALNTHFSQGITSVNMGPGITIVSPVTVISPSSASAVINIDGGAAAG